MKKLLMSLIIGLIAGIFDVVPMIIQKLDIYADFSAFSQWIILGIIISYIEIGLKGALKGLLIAEMSVIPILIIVSEKGLFSIVPIILLTAVLGLLVGFFSEKFAK
jgi:hypothetical protein